MNIIRIHFYWWDVKVRMFSNHHFLSQFLRCFVFSKVVVVNTSYQLSLKVCFSRRLIFGADSREQLEIYALTFQSLNGFFFSFARCYLQLSNNTNYFCIYHVVRKFSKSFKIGERFWEVSVIDLFFIEFEIVLFSIDFPVNSLSQYKRIH